MKARKLFMQLLMLLMLLFFIETISFLILRIMGIDPIGQHEKNLYGRTISGWYVMKDISNYSFHPRDGLDNFKIINEQTDDNGFIVDTNLKLQKDANTVRIFLIGGSAAFGSLESQNITNDTTYPVGNYSYQSSIAGLLKKELRHKYPQKTFEVVNAATVKHCFVQEWFKYLSTVHKFKPDIVINMTGFNDMLNMQKENMFGRTENELQKYIDNEFVWRQQSFPFTFYLCNYIIHKNRHGGVFNGTNELSKGIYEHVNYNLSDTSQSNFSRKLEPIFSSVSAQLYWSLDSYLAQLKHDEVHEIYCLQPMLSRRLYNKQLSTLELKLRKNCEANIQSTGIVVTEIYIDRDFTNIADSIVNANGADYIDMNKEIVGLTSKDEFFVDYCHLTPFGNQFVANKFAERISAYLDGQNR